MSSRCKCCSWSILVASPSFPSFFFFFLSLALFIHLCRSDNKTQAHTSVCILGSITGNALASQFLPVVPNVCFSPSEMLPFFFIYLSQLGPWSWVTEVEWSIVILGWKEFLSLPTAQRTVKGWKFACDFSSLHFLFSPTLFIVPSSSPSGLFWAPVAEAPQKIDGCSWQCQGMS